MGRLLREASPAFKQRGCVGFDVIVAIETQRCVAASGVHDGAVMRRGRIGMDIGPEMRAADAPALTTDSAARLERAEHLGESFDNRGALPINEARKTFVSGTSGAVRVAL